MSVVLRDMSVKASRKKEIKVMTIHLLHVVVVMFVSSCILFLQCQGVTGFIMPSSSCSLSKKVERRFRCELFRHFESSDSNENRDDEKKTTDESLSAESRQLFDDMTQELISKFRSSSSSSNPFATQVSRSVGKDSLYGTDELMELLDIHNDLSSNEIKDVEEEESEENDSKVEPSFHDLILQTLSSPSQTTQENKQKSESSEGSVPLSFSYDDDTKTKMTNICAIASDVDGTILTSDQKIHPRTRMAIKRAIDRASTDKNFIFFPATGKSRKGALDSLGVEMSSLIIANNIPGVYLQGLFCVDGNDNVLFEKKLNKISIAGAESLVEKYQISIVGYDGDNLYTTDQTDIVIHLHEHYGEPLPCLIPSSVDGQVINLADHGPGMHKLLLMDHDTERLANVIRPQLEAIAEESGACVTQALPTMLELLPKGCSKAVGVSKLCDALGVNMSTQLLALGDAENDAEMLRLASIGVAMGNASEKAKDAADFVMYETNNDGGAGAAMEIFGFGADSSL